MVKKKNKNKMKKLLVQKKLSQLVRAGRLELPHLAALDPKSSVSANSTTPAYFRPDSYRESGCKYN